MKTFEIHYEVTTEGSVEVKAESIEKALEEFDLGDADISDPCESVEKDKQIVAVTLWEWGKQQRWSRSEWK